MKDELKFVIYIRKSTEDKKRQILSLEAQKRELKGYASSQDLKVTKILEESQSAYKPGRPVFAEMMEMFELGLANAVLTWKPDRIARNPKEGGEFIYAMDEGKILELRTPYERYKRDDNRIMLYMLFGMSNDYSRQIGANVKRGNRQKYERGEYCGKAPLGYVNSKNGDYRNIEIDEEKGPLVRKIFEKFATSKYSIQGMVELADEWGLRSFLGNKIAKSGMYEHLKRTAYYGVFKHSGEYHQGSYEPLITKSLFDRVQEVLKDRSKPKKHNWIHTYKGLVKCGECGCSITAETKHKYFKGTDRDAYYTYYHCTRKRGDCSQEAVTGDDLEEMFGDMVEGISIDKEVWELGVKLLRKKYEVELDQQEKIRLGFEREYKIVDKKLGKLLDMRMNDEILAEEYSTMKLKILDEKQSLKEKLDDGYDYSMKWLELAEKFFENCYQGKEIMEGDNNEAKQQLIRAVGSDLILEDKKLSFTLEKPYDVLLKPQIRSDVQGW
ncbi:MAG: recombinase family protein [Candidatus Beckwithbacteria bacterium]